MPVDQFEDGLAGICGAFGIRSHENRKTVRGTVGIMAERGFEIAHVAADLAQVERTNHHIRSDWGENYFLICQEEGKALLSQNDQLHLLQPGDMMLIDSAKPSDFTLFGAYSRQVSVHLPRAELHERIGEQIVRGGTLLPRNDPMNLAMCSILSRVLDPNAAIPDAAHHLREAFLGALGAALHERSWREQYAGLTADVSGARALAAGQAYIDKRYRDPDFSIQQMAEDLQLSTRQLQRGFAAIGMTPTKYLLVKRLEQVRRALDDRKAGRNNDLISSIAYEAGFTDLSYFQRCFRRTFGITPRAYTSRS